MRNNGLASPDCRLWRRVGQMRSPRWRVSAGHSFWEMSEDRNGATSSTNYDQGRGETQISTGSRISKLHRRTMESKAGDGRLHDNPEDARPNHDPHRATGRQKERQGCL